MRLVSWFTCAALSAASYAGHALAQSGYPNKSIRIVAPMTPGASVDLMARAIAQKLNEALGQPVVVENRGGAGGAIGTEIVAKSPADGYTLLVTSTAYTTNAAVQPRLPFDPIADMTGVTMLAKGPMLVTVHPSVPAKSVQELVALARARPGQLSYVSSGIGTIPHLVTQVLAGEAKIKMVHVPYKGLGPAITDLVGGHVHLLIASLPSVHPQVKANRRRALAVSSEKRSPFVPQLPTIAESGFPGFAAAQWWGVFAPVRTPKDIVARLNGEIRQILATDEMRQRFANDGAEPAPMSVEEFNAFVRNEIAMWSKVVKEHGIRPE